MHPTLRLAAFPLLLALGACSGEDSTATGGGTAEEAVALDNAADMLDTSPDSLLADVPPGNGDAGLEAETGALPVSGEEATNTAD